MLGGLENSPVDEEVTDRIRWGSLDHALILLRQATNTSVSKMKSRLLALEIH